MTPEREAEIRDVDRVASRADLLRDVLVALDAERKAREAYLKGSSRIANGDDCAPGLDAIIDAVLAARGAR